jgi:hypothetical protein
MHHIWAESGANSRAYVIQINTKFANFAGIYFPHFITFRNQTLQSTNFNMLFLAVVMVFVILAYRV